MQISQAPIEPAFQPITIILETKEEAEVFKLIGNVYTTIAETVKKHSTSYHVGERRRKLITEVLGRVWNFPVIHGLNLPQDDHAS